jgi:two-component system response regulator
MAAKRNRLLLLVDDDAEFRSALAAALTEDGYMIEEAVDGNDALAKMTRRRPALILVDLLMPAMSGLELLQRMRRMAELRDIPTIVITAANDAMLSVRLDVPVLYKGDPDAVLRLIHDYVDDGRPSSPSASQDVRPR